MLFILVYGSIILYLCIGIGVYLSIERALFSNPTYYQNIVINEIGELIVILWPFVIIIGIEHVIATTTPEVILTGAANDPVVTQITKYAVVAICPDWGAVSQFRRLPRTGSPRTIGGGGASDAPMRRSSGGAAFRPANIVVVEPDGTARVGAGDLAFPNGTVILPGGTLVVAESGAGRLTAFAIGAISIIGLPPMVGVWSKWWIGIGAVEGGDFWVVAVLMISSLLNVAYLLPIVSRGFFMDPPGVKPGEKVKIAEAPLACGIAITVTAGLCIVLFVAANHIQPLIAAITEPVALATSLEGATDGCAVI